MLPAFLLSLVLPTVSAASSYIPASANCPSDPLVRPADGLSENEEAYRVARKAVADESLKTWLLNTNSGFGTDDLPTVALSLSGGGYRAHLIGAGVIQGFDERDSSVSTSGLYQGLTYQAALSGGGWLLSSLAGNNFPTVSYLKEEFWKQAFQDTIFDPDHLLVLDAYGNIIEDLTRKSAAGFSSTIVDAWGRLLSYQLLPGDDGGAAITISSLAKLSNFTSHQVPFPIMTSLGVRTWLGECGPADNATTYEFTPYEFGSWDSEVSAFTPTQYLGTTMQNGIPTGNCTSNYDNLGYVLGTSSNIFNAVCLDVPAPPTGAGNITAAIIEIFNKIHEITTADEYAIYKNPFFNYSSPTGTVNPANDIRAQPDLRLTDGGMASQNNPIFPLLQPARNVSVIIVSDNSADADNYPDGSALFASYTQSLTHGLTRMPLIPPVATFVAHGFDKRAAFFGCGDATKITIVSLPNTNYTFDSNVSTAQLQFSKDDTDGMIANGVQVATQGGRDGWGTCLGCALMMKTGQALPEECEACYEEYCYYSS